MTFKRNDIRYEASEETGIIPFLGLKKDPFSLDPEPEFFYSSKQHTTVLNSVKNSLQDNQGIFIILGEKGVGKTLIINIIINLLPSEKNYIYISNPMLSPKEMFITILNQLGVTVDASSYTLRDCFDLITKQLERLAQQGKRFLLIIDNAHAIPVETIEQLTFLANFEISNSKLAQIIMLGRTELKDKLQEKDFSYLAQEPLFKEIQPLTKDEVVNYVNHRLAVAGNTRLKIKKGAMTRLYSITRGYPLLINKVMSRALQFAYGDKRLVIDRNYINASFNSMAINIPKRNIMAGYRKTYKKQVYIAIACILFSIGLFFIITRLFLSYPNGQPNHYALKSSKSKNMNKNATTMHNASAPSIHNVTSLKNTYGKKQKQQSQKIVSQPVKSENATKTPYGIILKNPEKIRSGPGFQYPVICTCPEGTKITIIDAIGVWTHIKGCCNGWVPVPSIETRTK